MVIDINATEADPTPNAGRISYSLISPDYQLPHILSDGTAEFEINSTCGIITTEVDLETRADMYSSFYLTILAQDHGATPLSSTAQITILPLPVPHLVNPPSITVDENMINDRIADIECFVIGHTFSIPTVSVTAYGNYSQYFAVEATTWYTFALYTSRGLDYESLPEGNSFIEIELLCELPSVSDTPCVDSRVIEIEVLNVNDKFENDSYYTIIPENTTEGTVILTVSIFDGDCPINDTVIFSIINSSTYFTIDGNTGEILVSSQLDHAQQDRFILEVQAFQLSSGFTSVTIILSDVNGESYKKFLISESTIILSSLRSMNYPAC